MRKRNPMKKNNKGLTLIELVVTVAIIAIFSGIVLSIIGTSSNSFRTTSSTAKVQMKTQELLDTIQDLVIDANRSVYYEIGDQKIQNDIDGPEVNYGDSLSKRTFYVCSAKELSDTQELQKYDVLRWDPLTKEVRYSYKELVVDKNPAGENPDSGDPVGFSAGEAAGAEVGGDGAEAGDTGDGADDGSGGSSEAEGTFSVLAENVTSFRADVTKVKGLRIVRFRIVMNEKGKEITTLHTVNLRNEIQVAPPDASFPDVPENPISITLTPARTECFVGEEFRFFEAWPHGDVDVDSLVWEYLPSSQEMNAVLTVDGSDNRKASVTAEKKGTVTIKVTIRSADGRSTASADAVIAFVEKPKEKIAVEIITSPLEGQVGVEFPLEAEVTNGTAVPNSEKWEIIKVPEGMNASFVKTDGLNAVLKVNKPGTVRVRITVKNADGKEAFDEEDVIFRITTLKIPDTAKIEVEKSGATIDLTNLPITTELDGIAVPYLESVTWYCVNGSSGTSNGQSDNPFVSIDSGGQITISPDAWTASNGPGTFQVYAVGEEGAVSNKLTITIVSIRVMIDKPQNEAKGYIQDELTNVNIKYYVGNTETEYVSLLLGGEVWNKTEAEPKPFKITKTGTGISVKAIGNPITETYWQGPVEDEIFIDVLPHEYKIVGSSTMPITVAEPFSSIPFICNQNPYNLATDEETARTYWVVDENNQYVPATIVPVRGVTNGIITTVTFSATVPGAVNQPVNKVVDVVSVKISNPEPNSELIAETSYSCKANLYSGLTISGLTSGKWWANKIQLADTDPKILVDKKDETTGILLEVATTTMMTNDLASHNYTITDSCRYVVETTIITDPDQKWRVQINEPKKVIHIPTKEDTRASTKISATAHNPGNNGGNDFTNKSTAYKWKLYIPDLGICLQNGMDIASFPEGDGNAGASGFLVINNWTFPDEIKEQTLPGILYVECLANKNKFVSTSISVDCVVDGKEED